MAGFVLSVSQERVPVDLTCEISVERKKRKLHGPINYDKLALMP